MPMDMSSRGFNIGGDFWVLNIFGREGKLTFREGAY